MREVHISLSWRAIEIGGAQRYSYPQQVSRFVTGNYTKAGVYRWAVYGKGPEPMRAYIGETENFARRIGQYLRGDRSQKQVFRIKNELLEPARKDALRIEFQILDFEPLKLNGIPFASGSLSSEVLRKTMQWIAISTHDFVHCELYNKIGNPITRRRDKALKLAKGESS